MSENPLLSAFAKDLISGDPEVIASDAQIAAPEEPSFNRRDVPTSDLYKITNNDFNQIENLSQLIEDCSSYIPFLYSYRCISRAINNPEAHLKDIKDKEKINEQFNLVFQPRYQKMLQFMLKMEEVMNFLTSTINSMDVPPSNLFFQKMVDLFDAVMNLEHTKMLKVGLTVDLSIFRHQKTEKSDEENKLPVFLATPHYSLNMLKAGIASGSRKEPNSAIFIKFLDYCYDSYKKSITAKQKQQYVISMLSSLMMFGQKALSSKDNMSNIFTCIAEQPLIPLIGENHFEVSSVFQYIPDLSIPKGITMLTDKEKLKAASDRFLLKAKINEYRKMYRNNLNLINQVVRGGKIKQTDVFEIISCISELKNAITTQFAYKSSCTAPSNDQKVPHYDRQVRLNYTPEDLAALIEVIGEVKTIAGVALQEEAEFNQFIYKYISLTVQNFVHFTLGDTLASAQKKGEKSVEEYIERIRNIFGKFGDVSPSKIEKQSKDLEKGFTIPPSINQLNILREQVYALIQPNGPFTDKKGKVRSSFKQTVEEFQKFLDESVNYHILLNFSRCVRDSSNLGSLWFRETALDIETKNDPNIIQFPVRSSLPFILAEYILNASDKPALHECVFFPFEIYNDAAYMATNVFRSQYLYKEIEAEVSLCVDMISFTFSNSFFKSCREAATVSELPPECTKFASSTPFRYSSMVKQGKLQLLGSPVDFNLITTHKINDVLERELSSYVQLINDFRTLPFVNHLFKVIKTTHYLLKKNGLLLDDFDSIWSDAHMMQPNLQSTTLSSRLIDVTDPQHWTFNCVSRRFLPSKDLMLIPPSNENWGHNYIRLHSQDTKYIGSEHFAALVELLNAGELTKFITNMLGRLNEEISKFIEVYVTAASSLRLLPSSNNNDLFELFTFITDAYNGTQNPQLGQLFNSLRTIGNIIAFIYLIECEMKPLDKNISIIPSIVSIFKEHIDRNKDLFVANEFDPIGVISHRTFPSLWSILEFLLCTPTPVQFGAKDEVKFLSHPIETFGDGAIIAAYTFILLCGERGLYEYDSVCLRALNLYNVQRSVSNVNGELAQFIYYVTIAKQAMDFTEIIIHPYLEC